MAEDKTKRVEALWNSVGSRDPSPEARLFQLSSSLSYFSGMSLFGGGFVQWQDLATGAGQAPVSNPAPSRTVNDTEFYGLMMGA